MGRFSALLLMNPDLRLARLAGFAAIAVAFLLPGWACADNVLILNSYHRGKSLSDDTIEMIVSDLQTKHPELTFFVEDMDSKRNSMEHLRMPLLKCYSLKYQEVELRAVVTIDNNAFDFAMKNRRALFPGVPVVFCGFNGFQHSILDEHDNVTGVAEAIDLDATVKVALALHPKTTHLAVVSDTTKSGRRVLEEFREYAKTLPDSLQIVELVDVTARGLTAGLKSLPTDSVVLRLSFFRDAEGKTFRIEEQVNLIAAAGLPVYDFWDEGGIGSGYVGGYVVTGASQGRVVSRMLERILAGESANQIKVVDRSPNTPVFDKRELLRTGADISQLPVNAVVRFDAPSFWEKHRQLLIGIGIVFLILLGFAIFFAVLSFQRKRYAMALALEERKLRATLQSIGEGVVTTNTRGEVEQFNAVAEQWTGLPIERVRGRCVNEVFQLTDGCSNAVIELNAGDSLTATGQLETSCGEMLPVVRTAAPISLPNGKEVGTVIVFHDMTRENELQQKVEQVRRLDALGQLAGGVAHDFNNMLGGVIVAAELLIGKINDKELSKLPSLILESAKDAAELTGQLLSFARKQPVTKQSFHFHQIINDAIAVLKRTTDPRIEIDIRTDAAHDVVHGDRTLLKSCLLNLGINASHAMQSGGKLIFATRDLSLQSGDCEACSFDIAPGRYLELRVEDSGTGIPPEIVDRIFDPFFTTKELRKGTGLGLAAVFGTIKQHNGSVAVETELGRGTCFVVLLPLAQQQISQVQELDTSVPGEGVVLVVDDEQLLQMVASKMLGDLGYEVLTASDGLEAIEVYRRERGRIDVVLLDMMMPRMNGQDCFVALQRIDPEVCVVAASGFSCPDELQKMSSLGLTAQLSKPYQRADLSRAVSNAIGPSNRKKERNGD